MQSVNNFYEKPIYNTENNFVFFCKNLRYPRYLRSFRPLRSPLSPPHPLIVAVRKHCLFISS
jgi:hypothetical protein